MSSITIYLEGGGDGKNTKSALRLGMDAFSESPAAVPGVRTTIQYAGTGNQPSLSTGDRVIRAGAAVPHAWTRLDPLQDAG